MGKHIFKAVLFILIGGFVSCKMDNKEVDSFSLEQVNSPKEMVTTASTEKLTSRTVLDYLPTSTTHQVIKHSYFTLSYNEEAEQAEWLAYQLKKDYVKNNNFKRPFFIVDPKVRTGSADWRNYKKSGYDKGHLCPAGDMEFEENAYNDTFFTSNISPQDHEFNAGIWNRLEQKVRYWASRYDGVYVVTGGILNKTSKTIGTQKVVVPEYFYKIILDDSNGNCKMIAFLIPNKGSDKPLYTYVVSVDSIENLTGIDFFPKLDDELESSLEKRTDYKSWIFN
ncbi:DNA/RNA non-specific endonuclease [Flavobacterium sp. WC2416]